MTREPSIIVFFMVHLVVLDEIQRHYHWAPLDHAYVEATTWATPHERMYKLTHHLVEMSRQIQTCHLL